MILDRLRLETRALHQRVERAVGFPRCVASLDRYVAMLQRLFGFYEPIERQLREGRATVPADLASQRLLKSSWLRDDLIVCGIPNDRIAKLPRCRHVPAIRKASAWGCLYVLEGATLGGQIIRRELQRALPLPTDRGAAFFSSYGSRVGEMWTSFCQALNVFGAREPASGDEIIEGAIATFTCFEEWVAC
jgi:heme oxygenase